MDYQSKLDYTTESYNNWKTGAKSIDNHRWTPTLGHPRMLTENDVRRHKPFDIAPKYNERRFFKFNDEKDDYVPPVSPKSISCNPVKPSVPVEPQQMTNRQTRSTKTSSPSLRNYNKMQRRVNSTAAGQNAKPPPEIPQESNKSLNLMTPEQRQNYTAKFKPQPTEFTSAQETPKCRYSNIESDNSLIIPSSNASTAGCYEQRYMSPYNPFMNESMIPYNQYMNAPQPYMNPHNQNIGQPLNQTMNQTMNHTMNNYSQMMEPRGRSFMTIPEEQMKQQHVNNSLKSVKDPSALFLMLMIVYVLYIVVGSSE